MKLTEHLENTLGPIEHGWTVDSSGKKIPFQIIQFPERNGFSYFSTLGLSNSLLLSAKSGRRMRCELLMLAKPNDPAPSLLQQVGCEMIQAGAIPLRGEVIGPRGPMISGSQMTCLYVSAPAYLPESFTVCADEELGEVIFIWLVPIHSAEADFVREKGWEEFEALLESSDPDLANFARSSLLAF